MKYREDGAIWDTEALFGTSLFEIPCSIFSSSIALWLVAGVEEVQRRTTGYIHKLKIVLKELRETRVWLLMIVRAGLIQPAATLDPLIQETNELISIFVTSVKTATKGRT